MLQNRVRTALMGALASWALLGPAVPALAQRTPVAKAGSLPDEGPDHDRASCVLVLKGSTRNTMNVGPFFDLAALTTAMTTTALIDPAAKSALGLGPREWPKVVRVEIAQVGQQAVKLTVSVDPKGLDKPGPADTLLRDLVERAKRIVDQSAEPRRQELNAKLEELEKRRSELRPQAEAIRKRLREAESSGLRVNNDFAANQRRQVESELIGKRARLQAVKELTPKDDFSVAMKGLVEAREALVAGLEKAAEQGKAESLELLRARADLAEARVRAADPSRISGFGATTAGPRFVGNDRLGLEVDVATLEAQLKALPEKEDRPKPTQEDANAARSELFRVDSEINNVEQQIQQARREMDQVGSPPTLLMLDGQKGD